MLKSMKKNFNIRHTLIRYSCLVVFVVIAVSLMHVNGVVYADSKSEVCQGIAVLSTGSSCKSVTEKNSLGHLVGIIVDFLSIILGIIAVIILIIGGLKYITSAGEPKSVAEAKHTIVYAIIGLIIAASASLIVHLVLKTAIGF